MFLVFMVMAGDVFRFCVGKGGFGYNVMGWGRGDEKVRVQGEGRRRRLKITLLFLAFSLFLPPSPFSFPSSLFSRDKKQY